MNLYDTLGLEPGATAEQVRTAYRTLAMKHHPDRTGGDDAAFKAIKHAYEVLSDEARRASYDETGEDLDQRDQSNKALSMVMSMLIGAAEMGIGPDEDFLVGFNAVLDDKMLRLTGNIIGMQEDKRHRQKLAARIARKTPGPNLLRQGLQASCGVIDNAIAAAQAEIANVEQCRALLAEYESPVDGSSRVALLIAEVMRR